VELVHLYSNLFGDKGWSGAVWPTAAVAGQPEEAARRCRRSTHVTLLKGVGSNFGMPAGRWN
jgi:hypothetical protein